MRREDIKTVDHMAKMLKMERIKKNKIKREKDGKVDENDRKDTEEQNQGKKYDRVKQRGEQKIQGLNVNHGQAQETYKALVAQQLPKRQTAKSSLT